LLPEVDGFVIVSDATFEKTTVAVELAPSVVFEITLIRRVEGNVSTDALAVPFTVTVVFVTDDGIVVPVGKTKCSESFTAIPPVPVVNVTV